jgi:hypothetical protein
MPQRHRFREDLAQQRLSQDHGAAGHDPTAVHSSFDEPVDQRGQRGTGPADHVAGKHRTLLGGMEDLLGVTADPGGRARGADRQCQFRPARDLDAVQQPAAELIGTLTPVQGAQHRPGGFADQAGRAPLVAQHPAPAARGHQPAADPGHRDRTGAGNDTDPAVETQRRRQQLGIVNHPNRAGEEFGQLGGEEVAQFGAVAAVRTDADGPGQGLVAQPLANQRGQRDRVLDV